jgi:hypothetical protein
MQLTTPWSRGYDPIVARCFFRGARFWAEDFFNRRNSPDLLCWRCAPCARAHGILDKPPRWAQPKKPRLFSENLPAKRIFLLKFQATVA